MSIHSTFGGILLTCTLCFVSVLIFYLTQYVLYTGTKLDAGKRKTVHLVYTGIFFLLVSIMCIVICIYHASTVKQFKYDLCRVTYLANTESMIANNKTKADYVSSLKSVSKKLDKAKFTKKQLDYINHCEKASLTFKSWEKYFNTHFTSSTNASTEAQDLWVDWISTTNYLWK